jgi:hypothetical protein
MGMWMSDEDMTYGMNLALVGHKTCACVNMAEVALLLDKMIE